MKPPPSAQLQLETTHMTTSDAGSAPGSTYRSAGVDIEEGDLLVEKIKPHARRTLRPEVLAGIGGFGGLFELPKRYQEPVLVVGTDGVGTKLKLAFLTGRHNTVGIDLVAMSVNDVVVCGAEPLVFLDYFATSRLRAAEAEKVIAGIADGCLLAGCTLIGGETAELPGFYGEGEYDLAGFCVGVVEKDRILDGSRVKVGDVVLGLASTGLHSNGYSLARKVLLETAGLPLDAALADTLLAPTRIYVKDCLALREALDVKAFAHITGGGLPGNLPRVLPEQTRARLSASAWRWPEIFGRIQDLGRVEQGEMLRTFNCGIGMCAVLHPSDVTAAQALLEARGVPSWPLGVIEAAPELAESEVVIGP
jgi:phosphoribosylformylglycinamidine cyclo-ligase